MVGITDFITKMISTVAEPIMMEIGQHSGSDTEMLLSHLRVSRKPFRFFGFEPVPALYNRLTRFNAPNVQIFEMAIGQIDGEMPLFISDGPGPNGFRYDCSSSIRKPKNVCQLWPMITFSESKTKCCRLDTFMQLHNVPRVDFIWADVQGAEIDMIIGMGSRIKDIRSLYTEFDDRELYEGELRLDQITALLPGWKIVNKDSTDVLFQNMS